MKWSRLHITGLCLALLITTPLEIQTSKKQEKDEDVMFEEFVNILQSAREAGKNSDDEKARIGAIAKIAHSILRMFSLIKKDKKRNEFGQDLHDLEKLLNDSHFLQNVLAKNDRIQAKAEQNEENRSQKD